MRLQALAPCLRLAEGISLLTAVWNKAAIHTKTANCLLLRLKLMRFGESQFSGECYDAALQKAVKQAADKIKRDI